MTVTAIVGANWGDEGKGKITDYLAREADFVVRFQGGNNAGHTIINEYGKFALHLLPAGVFYPHVHNVIGPGVALNMTALLKELADVTERGLPVPKLTVSERAQIVLPVHNLLDGYEEERLGAEQFGSTRSGIAPFYADKYLKIGVQVADLFDRDRLAQRVQRSLVNKNVLIAHLYNQSPVDPEEATESLWLEGRRLEPFIGDTTRLLQEGLAQGQRIILEGQLGALRDPDHGIYPFSTSSSTLAGFATVGAGIPPYAMTHIVAVVKAYSTCVGAGPFVTELFGETANELRERGGDAGEYGATTGRPRRVGWFDAVATRYGCQVQGATEVALTNLDVLGHWREIPLCVGYELNGETTTQFPVTGRLEHAQPVFETMPGWQSDISSIRSYERLPEQARRYVERVEQLIGTPIRLLSVGPRREDIIMRS